MNHFLHLLVLLPAIFTTIVALPTPIDDTSNSWTDSPLDNADTLLAATFGGSTDNPLTSPYGGVTSPDLPPTVPVQPPPPTVDNSDWSRPMFLCCSKNSSWLSDDERVQCVQRMECIQWGHLGEFADPMCIESRRWNDENCTGGQGTAKYCPRGIRVSFFFFFFSSSSSRRRQSEKMGECSYRIQANLKFFSLPLDDCLNRLLQVSCWANRIKKKLLHKQKIIIRAKSSFFQSDEPQLI